jgi:PAS domain S-box-containing protein
MAMKPLAGKNAARPTGWSGWLLLVMAGVLSASALLVSSFESRRAATFVGINDSLSTLLSTLKDAETGQRGFLLTREERYLEPYHLALARLSDDFAQAESALGGTAALGRLRNAIAAKLAELDETIAKTKAGEIDAALGLVRSELGKRVMDSIRTEIADLSATAIAGGAISRSRSQLFLGASAVCGLALLALGLANVVRLVRANEELAINDAHLQLLIDGVRDHAIYMLDADGRILTWSTGAELLKGFSAEDVIGKHYETLFSPEDRRASLPAKLLERARTEAAVDSEGLRIRKDGSSFPAHIHLTALFDNAGHLRGYCKIARDMSIERDAETRRQVTQEAQLRMAHSQKMEALGQLAGGIAHDFNNILQAAHGASRLLLREPDDPTRVRRMATIVQDLTERGSSITNRLLAFSRRSTLNKDRINPNLLLGSMRKLLMHTLGTGIRVVIDSPSNLPAVEVDKGQLETVLINLATNARDAMDGVGQLTLGAGVCEVKDLSASGLPECLTRGGYLRLSVTDTGVGMLPGVLARATEPFFTTKPMGQGTGLGLAMARGFSEQSGGGLQIQSTPGGGTTVTIWLPLSVGEIEYDGLTGASKQVALRNARILLVDDDTTVRELVAEELEIEGYSVLSIPSGPAALDLLDAGVAVDLIVSDYSMPDMDGVAFLHEARARRQALPAILMTGLAGKLADQVADGPLTMDWPIVSKPINVQRLAARIDDLLEEGAGCSTRGS